MDVTEPGADALRDARRRFAWAGAAGGALAMVVLAWLATRGFSTLFDRPYLGNLFDAQARSLFHGHWDVPGDVPTFERFAIDGRYYMYFGPTPSVLRMPLLLVTDSLDGRLSRLSVIAASAVVVFGIARLSWLARRSVRGDRPVSFGETVIAAGVVVAGSLGTVVPYVAEWSAMYHEAIIWGLAFALVSYGALVAWLLDARSHDLAIAGVTAALSLLSRASVGLGPVAALAIVALVRIVAAVRARRAGAPPEWAVLGGLAAAVVVPLALYGYVNAAKFGSAFGSPPYAEQDLLAHLDFRKASLADNDGSLVGIRYAPTALLHYLRPDGLEVGGLFPWVVLDVPRRVIGDVVFDNVRPTSSTTATAPLALLFALGGAVLAAAHRTLRRWWLPAVIGTLVGGVGTVSVAFIDHRYQGDFVPFLVVAGALAAWSLVAWASGRSRAVVGALLGGVLLLGAWSVWVNVALAYVHQRSQTVSSVDDRASLVETQLDVQDLLGRSLPSTVGTGDELPAQGSLGDLVALDGCRGVYRHDGREWLPVEQTPDTGYHRLALRLDRAASGRQPVLSSADENATTVLWARNESGGDEVAFEYRWESADPDDPHSTRVALGAVDRNDDGTVDLSVRVDPRIGITDYLQVRANGSLLFEGIVNKLHGAVELGAQDTLPGATSLAGDVHRRGAETPICDRLVGLGLPVA